MGVEESPVENIVEDRDEDIDSAVENENVTSGLLKSSSNKPQKRKSTLPALQKQTDLTQTRKKAKLGKKDDKRSKNGILKILKQRREGNNVKRSYKSC